MMAWHTICVITQAVDPSESQVERAVGVLRMLADPTRLRIVWALLHGEHSVNDLADHVGVHAAAVSQHLAKLRLSGVVRTRRDGNRIFYVADDDHVRRVATEALLHAGAAPPSPDSARHHRGKAVS